MYQKLKLSEVKIKILETIEIKKYEFLDYIRFDKHIYSFFIYYIYI